MSKIAPKHTVDNEMAKLANHVNKMPTSVVNNKRKRDAK